MSSTLKIEKELKEICDDILDVLDKHLIPSATAGESKVFYYKMLDHKMLISVKFGIQ